MKFYRRNGHNLYDNNILLSKSTIHVIRNNSRYKVSYIGKTYKESFPLNDLFYLQSSCYGVMGVTPRMPSDLTGSPTVDD